MTVIKNKTRNLDEVHYDHNHTCCMRKVKYERFNRFLIASIQYVCCSSASLGKPQGFSFLLKHSKISLTQCFWNTFSTLGSLFNFLKHSLGIFLNSLFITREDA